MNRSKLKAKLLNTYYGHPIKDMQLIAITGTTGKTIVAHYVHEILKSAGKQVAVLASDQPFKIGMLHKFLSDAWKAGANYVIITVPSKSLKENIFFDLPIQVAAMTNYITSSLKDMTPKEYLDNEKTLFDMKPEVVVLNADDANFPTFSNFRGKKQTITFGKNSDNLKILNSKLYTKGTEASLSYHSEIIPVATFITGEVAVSYMASAAAIALALDLPTASIIDGIANYDPEESSAQL